MADCNQFGGQEASLWFEKIGGNARENLNYYFCRWQDVVGRADAVVCPVPFPFEGRWKACEKNFNFILHTVMPYLAADVWSSARSVPDLMDQSYPAQLFEAWVSK